MRLRRFGLVAAFAVVGVMLTGSMALAADLEDGDYTLMLPGVGEFIFIIDSGESETVVAVAPIPAGYVIDDDQADKVAWKDFALILEVEAKTATATIEGDYDWLDEFGNRADAVLSLPDGGSITVTEPEGDGSFAVTASGDWFAFGDGKDWYVANSDNGDDILLGADLFFKVEATADGVEIKAVDEPDIGFLDELAEADEEAAERGNGRGHSHSAAVHEILAKGGSPSEIAGDHG